MLKRGEDDAGTILLVLTARGGAARLYERMPAADGTRNWTRLTQLSAANPQEIDDYLARRRAQDDDLWIVELDIAAAERFIGLPPAPN